MEWISDEVINVLAIVIVIIAYVHIFKMIQRVKAMVNALLYVRGNRRLTLVNKETLQCKT